MHENIYAGVIRERPDSSLDTEIEALLKAGEAVMNLIGPWDQARPESPQGENISLNMLTPSGFHFGSGSFEKLWNEPMGRVILDPATRLMQGLTAKDNRH